MMRGWHATSIWCSPIRKQRNSETTTGLRRTGRARAYSLRGARATTCRASRAPCGQRTTVSPKWWTTARTSARRASTSTTFGLAADTAPRPERSQWRNSKWRRRGGRVDGSLAATRLTRGTLGKTEWELHVRQTLRSDEEEHSRGAHRAAPRARGFSQAG